MIDDGWLVMDDWWWVMDDGWVLKIMRIFREFRKYRFWDFYITCSRVETLHPCSVSHNSLFELCFVKFFSKCVKVKVIFLNYKMLNDKYPCYISPSIKTTLYTATYFYGRGIGCGDFRLFLSPIFTLIAEFPWVTHTPYRIVYMFFLGIRWYGKMWQFKKGNWSK